MGLIGSPTRVQFVQNNNAVLVFDASMREGHKRDSPATKFPIESGKNISDHIVIDPFSLDLVCIISDTPIGNATQLLTEAATTLASALIPPALISGAAIGLSIFSAAAGVKKRTSQSYEQLLALQDNKMPFDVVTSLKRYGGMYVTGLSAPRTLEDGQSVAFAIKLEQLIIVSPQTVDVSVFANPGLAAAAKDQGEKNAGIPSGFEQGYTNLNSKLNTFRGGGS